MWKIPEIAPKTGEQILADVGLPYPVVVSWNKHQKQWAYASLQLNFVEGTEDPYFETDWSECIKKWMPLPDMT
jgi:hypothetical protein